ncbi:hypothetical protein GALMADRAFT_1249933 [Galerina marginata CBS 339.88]|uniref:Uncharacterized protein n=1 Tax=Galerina marginata (strain CBS 339.88) TaxID=685588 RepID=A0A067THM2_GALM3|nr:hypothetical protein GALMADRAFT_1249933 [Galerina marginata CBS 339.88]
MCGEVCRLLYKEHPKSGGNVATAITHPKILNDGYEFGRVFGVQFDLYDLLQSPSHHSGMVVIQKYLRDRKRAGRYFVDGGRYASLSIHLLQIISTSSEDEQEKGRDGTSDYLDGEALNDDATPDKVDDEYMPEPNDKRALEFVISALPFYLSNADYNPMLAGLSRSTLTQKIEEKLPELHAKIKLLYDATHLYLQVSLMDCFYIVLINVYRKNPSHRTNHRPSLSVSEQINGTGRVTTT